MNAQLCRPGLAGGAFQRLRLFSSQVSALRAPIGFGRREPERSVRTAPPPVLSPDPSVFPIFGTRSVRVLGDFHAA